MFSNDDLTVEKLRTSVSSAFGWQTCELDDPDRGDAIAMNSRSRSEQAMSKGLAVDDERSAVGAAAAAVHDNHQKD